MNRSKTYVGGQTSRMTIGYRDHDSLGRRMVFEKRSSDEHAGSPATSSKVVQFGIFLPGIHHITSAVLSPSPLTMSLLHQPIPAISPIRRPMTLPRNWAVSAYAVRLRRGILLTKTAHGIATEVEPRAGPGGASSGYKQAPVTCSTGEFLLRTRYRPRPKRSLSGGG